MFGVCYIGQKNSTAHRDFDREMSRDEPYLYWDDSARNQLSPGDLFGIVDGREQQRRLKTYEIVSVIPPEERLEHWNTNGYRLNSEYNTSERNLLVLRRVSQRTLDWEAYLDSKHYNAKRDGQGRRYYTRTIYLRYP